MSTRHTSRRLRTWITVPVLTALAVLGLPLVPGVPSIATAEAADYRSTILADNPVSYWRMGQSGNLVIDEMGLYANEG